MRTIRHALHGLLLLCAALFLTACESGRLVTRTEIVEVPRRQYVKMPADLTRSEAAPVAPAPKCVQDGKPVRCNGQLLDYVDALLEWGGRANDKLDAILGIEAKAGAVER